MTEEQVVDDESEDFYDEGPRGTAAIFGPTVNAIFAPQAAFDALVVRPVLAIWPLIWVTLGAVVMGFLNSDITRQTFRLGMIEGMQRQGQELDPEQLRPMLEGIDKWAPVMASAGNLFLVVFVVVVAALFWMASSLSGGSTSFVKAFGVAAIGSVITPLLLLGFMTLMWQIDPPEFRRIAEFQRATPNLSLALIFGGEEASTFVTTLLQSVSLFNVWWIYVTAIGCRTLLEIKSGAAWGAPIVIWLIMSLISSGLASMNG